MPIDMESALEWMHRPPPTVAEAERELADAVLEREGLKQALERAETRYFNAIDAVALARQREQRQEAKGAKNVE